jgi:Ca2+-binding RTX toxin-like protein
MARTSTPSSVQKSFTDGDDIVTLTKFDDTVHALVGNDVVHGSDGNDILFGDDGNDTLFGDYGNDTLFGGAGNDTLLGGAGTNLLDGGTGTNTADYTWYQQADQPVYISLTAGYAVDQSNSGTGSPPTLGQGQTFNDTLRGIQNAIGAPNTTNTIIGDINANVLTGGNLADRLEGGDGNDTILGGNGDDLIVGGKGNDILTGGAGADTFIYDFNQDVSLGVDHVTDFQSGAQDLLSFFATYHNTASITVTTQEVNGVLEATVDVDIDGRSGTTHVVLDGLTLADPVNISASLTQVF